MTPRRGGGPILTLEKLRAFFTSSRRLASYIHFLDLTHASHSMQFPSFTESDGSREDGGVDSELLFAVLALCPRLRHVFLDSVMLKSLTVAGQQLSLAHLEISHDGILRDNTLVDIMAILLSFERIGTFVLTNTVRPGSGSATVPNYSVTKAVKVDALRLPRTFHPLPPVALCKLLSRCIDMGSVRNLELGEANHPAFRDILRQVGPNITALTFIMLPFRFDFWSPGE